MGLGRMGGRRRLVCRHHGWFPFLAIGAITVGGRPGRGAGLGLATSTARMV